MTADKTLPKPAQIILDFVGNAEAPKGYDTIFGNNQGRLKTPITELTVDQILKRQGDFTRRYGSSASGRYQFMRATLRDLKTQGHVQGDEVFTPAVQDWLGMALLRRRGYDDFVSGDLSVVAFARNLAQEWAGFPVLAATKGRRIALSRGQSYYTGDPLNRATVSADDFEAMLHRARDGEIADTRPKARPGAVVSSKGRTSPAQSTTVQASAAQIVTGAGSAAGSVAMLDGTAQIVALVFCGLVVLLAVWILRERLKRWAGGDR